ncbi:MAG: AraC family transcriptional regulator [Cyanobacteria bacterium]|nr:AraC family transcriptional regulator [Cyanobacteriota bacterium]
MNFGDSGDIGPPQTTPRRQPGGLSSLPPDGDPRAIAPMAEDAEDPWDRVQRHGLTLSFRCRCRPLGQGASVQGRSEAIAFEAWTLTLSAGDIADPSGHAGEMGEQRSLGLDFRADDRVPAPPADPQFVQINLYVAPDRLQGPDLLPPNLWLKLTDGRGATHAAGHGLTAAMRLVLHQMLHCPFEGAMRHMYFEGKSIELLTLGLDQARAQAVGSPPHPQGQATALSPRDFEDDRIHRARDILLQNFQNPPSLKELAYRVGINDCTLKRRFKQVFGTTVFGYLYDYRMEQARRWLLEQPWSVTEVARRVGYTNLCAFSTAFRKKFGVSPRSLQRQGRISSGP